jgi:uncharacterized membrane protein
MNPEQQPAAPQLAPQPTAPEQKTNGLAIGALVCAFFIPILGLILGIVAKSQIKKTGEGGSGLATAAIIISIIYMVITVILIVVLFMLGVFAAVQESPSSSTSTSSTSSTSSTKNYTADEQKAVNTSEAFLQAIKNSDFTSAYNQMGPELKKEYKDAADFAAQAKSKNLNLIKDWEVTTVTTNSSDGGVIVKGDLTASGANASGTFEFGYYKDTDGTINMLSYQLSPN